MQLLQAHDPHFLLGLVPLSSPPPPLPSLLSTSYVHVALGSNPQASSPLHLHLHWFTLVLAGKALSLTLMRWCECCVSGSLRQAVSTYLHLTSAVIPEVHHALQIDENAEQLFWSETAPQSNSLTGPLGGGGVGGDSEPELGEGVLGEGEVPPLPGAWQASDVPQSLVSVHHVCAQQRLPFRQSVSRLQGKHFAALPLPYSFH